MRRESTPSLALQLLAAPSADYTSALPGAVVTPDLGVAALPAGEGSSAVPRLQPSSGLVRQDINMARLTCLVWARQRSRVSGGTRILARANCVDASVATRTNNSVICVAGENIGTPPPVRRPLRGEIELGAGNFGGLRRYKWFKTFISSKQLIALTDGTFWQHKIGQAT